MSKAAASLELEVSRERALAACRTAIAGIDWEVVESDADLGGRQDPARLCCRSAPVTVEIELTEAGANRTDVRLHGSVPGFGLVAKRDLGAAMSLLASAIGRRSAEPV